MNTNEKQLPPLPEAYCWDIETSQVSFTADQMRAYGQACAAAALSQAGEPVADDTVTLVGIKNGVEHVLGTATMPPKMKAREMVREQFGSIDEDGFNDAAMALWVCEHLIDWMAKTTPRVYTAPQAQQGEVYWRHVANEWADAATNGTQWLRNVRDGVSTTAQALEDMETNCKRIQTLSAPEAKAEPVGLTPMTAGKTHEPDVTQDMWTAGINIPGHGHAVECYGATAQAAEALRDSILAAATLPRPVEALRAGAPGVTTCQHEGLWCVVYRSADKADAERVKVFAESPAATAQAEPDDTKRMDWLTRKLMDKKGYGTIEMERIDVPQMVRIECDFDDAFDGDTLRAAIDAAMAASGSEGAGS